MLSYKLLESADLINSEHEKFSPLFDITRLLAEKFDLITGMLSGLSGSGDKQTAASQKIAEVLTGFRVEIREIPLVPIVLAERAFAARLLESFVEPAPPGILAQRAADTSFAFVTALDEYARRNNSAKAVELLAAAKVCFIAIDSFFAALHYFNDWAAPVKAENGETDFSLQLDGEFSLADFASRLTALQDLYDQLSKILASQYEVLPLRIGKIESGSAWISLLGDPKVLALLGEIIRGLASVVKGNYSFNAKLSKIEDSAKVIGSLADLRDRFEAMGIPTDVIETELKNSGESISRNLSTLVAGQSSVSVNGKKFSMIETLVQLTYQEPTRLGYDKREPEL